MDFQPTQEQRQIQEMVAEFVDEEVVPRASEIDETDEFPWDLVDQMADLGLMGMPIDEADGGVGLDYHAYADALAEISRGSGGLGTIVAAHGDTAWAFRVRFPTHAAFSRFHRYCREHDIETSLRRVYTVADPGTDEAAFDLTPAQHETLVAALAADYFAVPRGVTLADLARDLDISEQATSERLRRGTRKVLEVALDRQPPPSTPP